FSSFDTESADLKRPEELAPAFREFRPYLESCRFVGCSHVKEKGCAVREAVRADEIPKSRHQSYIRLYEKLREAYKAWE
ncbi:MAG: ribosome small subunit-dependent GTPase A, partial [bacterium]